MARSDPVSPARPWHPHRLQFSRGQALLPELSTIGYDRWDRAEAGALPAHAHRGYEICYLARGSVDWWAEGSIQEVGPGEIYLTRPGERHGGLGAIMHPCELFWLLVSIPKTGALPGLSASETRAIKTGLDQIHLRAFPGTAAVGECFGKIIEEHGRPDAHSVVVARAALHELLATVLRSHQRQQRERPSPMILAAMEWIRSHLAEDFRIEDVATEIGLGISQLHQRFVKEVGFTPADYRMRSRINRAKRMLAEEKHSITTVAMELGFSTSQYFATAFKNQVGLTPRKYRHHLSQRTQRNRDHGEESEDGG
jgi:AraC-like DNA-binding protein